VDALSLLVTDSLGAEAATPSNALQRIAFLKKAQIDAVKAQLSAGWKKVEQMVPTQAEAIRLLADTSVEQADAALLGAWDKTIAFVAEQERALGSAQRKEAKELLAEMRSALSSAQGQIDPSSSKAFALIDQIVGGAPISAGMSAIRRRLLQDLQSMARTSPSIRSITDLYYRLDGPMRAVGTVLLAGAAGAGWVAANLKSDSRGVGFDALPPVALPKYGTRAEVGSLRFASGELSQLAGSIRQQVGKSGLSVTAAATYKKADPLYAAGGVRYTTYLPQEVRVSSSVEVESRFQPGTTAYSARLDVEKSLGRKKDLDLAAYAKASQAASGGRTTTEGGVTLTQRFGADTLRAPQRTARRVARGTPAVVRRLTGPLPWLQRLFRPRRGEPIVSQPYLAPTPTSPPLSPAATRSPWLWVVGTLLVGGIGWWGWRAWSRSSA
jgi:hypothetical protein